MTPRHVPTVTVNGMLISKTWGAVTVVSVDRLVFTWGRSNITDPTQPAELQAYFVDTLGTWASNPALFGSTVTVSTALGSTFRGVVDGLSISPVSLINPTTGRPQDVFLVSLTAVDPLAALNKTTPAGPGDTVQPLANVAYGPQHFPLNSTVGVASWLQSVLGPFVDNFDWPPFPEPQLVIKRLLMSDKRTLSDFIAQVYSIRSLAWLNYDSQDHRMKPGELAAWLHRRLSIVNGFVAHRADFGYALAAETLEYAGSDRSLTLGLQTSFSDVVHEYSISYGTTEQVNGQALGTRGYQPEATPFAVPDAPRRGLSTYSVNNDVAYADGNYPPSFITEFTAGLLSRLNYQLSPPPLRFDLEKTDYGSALETVLLGTHTVAFPIYIMGSELGALENFHPRFQIIGGTLTYSGGWDLVPYLAPTQWNGLTSVTLDAATSGMTATVGNFHPSFSLADLSSMTGPPL
jgi:hypothetical protein